MVHRMRPNHKNNTTAGILEWHHANEVIRYDLGIQSNSYLTHKPCHFEW